MVKIARYTKSAALDLVKYVKSVEITASAFNPRSRSCFALYEQMNSAKFKEMNPKYSCSFKHVDDKNVEPRLKVSYMNNMVWDIDPGDYTSQRLRSAIFSRAHDCEIIETIANADKPENL